MRVAPEGWPFILAGWTIAAAAGWAVWRWGGAGGGVWAWALVGVVVALAAWLVAFFRDPVPGGPRGERFVLAPAQGKVVEVATVDEPMYLKAPANRISIFLSVFDVHVNRYPVSGRVELVDYHPGKFLHAAADKASLENEQASIGIRGPRGPVLVRQIAGLIARRIVTDAKPGARATQAGRLGLIRFGSRTDVFLPVAAHAALRVKPGDRVIVGETVLAEYAR